MHPLDNNVEPKNNDQAKECRNDGDEHFRKGKFLNAVQSYNQALCYAETPKELSLAYAGRSAVYMKLKLFKECLENIDLATEKNESDKQLGELITKKKECLKLMTEYENFDPCQDAKNFFKLSHPSHPKIPFAIDGVEVQQNEVYGRGLYAVYDLNPGDILAIETPVINILYDTSGRYARCCNCLKINNFNLIPCKISSSLMFCSLDCQSWVYSKLSNDQLGSMLRNYETDYLNNIRYEIAFNSLGLSNQDCDTAWREKEDKTIFDCDNLQSKDLAKCLFTLACLTEYQDATNFIDYFKGIMQANRMSLQHFCDRGLGLGACSEVHGSILLLYGCFFNHSCDPNVAFFAKGNEIVFCCTKPVKKGKQLFISYGPLFANQTRMERRLDVKGYEFTCQCGACLKCYPKINIWDYYSKATPVESLSVTQAIDEFKRNNQVIKNEFKSYPNSKLCFLILRNLKLMQLIASYAVFPAIS